MSPGFLNPTISRSPRHARCATRRGRDKASQSQLTRDATSAKMSVFSESYGRNDLEAVTSVRFPGVARTVAALRCASPAARMTGSGACAFAAFADERAAQSALATLPRDVAGRVV